MADYQSPLQKQLDELANWLRGNSDQVVDATKPATNYRGFPSRESVAASREAAKQRASDGPTFLSPDWFAKMYGQKSADAISTVPAAVPDVVPATPALPAAPTRRPVRPALAAAPQLSPMEFQGMPVETERPPELSPMEFQGMPPAAAQAPAQAPRQSYADMFKEILAQKQAKLEAPLSEDQKRALQLQFFLGMMSNSSKPGARIFGAMGDAGKTTLAAQQGMQKENLNRAEKERANQLETAYKMLDIRHKDESDQRLDRREATEAEYRKAQEKRFETQDKRDQRRLDIEEEKLKQSGNDVIGRELLENGNIGLVTKRGMIDSGFKGKKPSEKNTQIDFYSWLMKNPDAEKLFLRERGPQPMNDKDAMTIATKMMESTPPNPGETPIQQLQRLSAGIVNASAASRNPQPSRQTQSFASKADVEAALKAGKISIGDAVMVNGKKFKVSE